MGVPAYLQLDLEADLVLPPAPAGRVDNQNNRKNTRSDRNVVKGARAARIQQNKWIENPKNGNDELLDPVVAEATLDFRNLNKRKLLTNFPTFLPQDLKIVSKCVSSIDVSWSVILWRMTWAWR
ncbi:unnamed protein product [Camellia sinensis]